MSLLSLLVSWFGSQSLRWAPSRVTNSTPSGYGELGICGYHILAGCQGEVLDWYLESAKDSLQGSPGPFRRTEACTKMSVSPLLSLWECNFHSMHEVPTDGTQA